MRRTAAACCRSFPTSAVRGVRRLECLRPGASTSPGSGRSTASSCCSGSRTGGSRSASCLVMLALACPGVCGPGSGARPSRSWRRSPLCDGCPDHPVPHLLLVRRRPGCRRGVRRPSAEYHRAGAAAARSVHPLHEMDFADDADTVPHHHPQAMALGPGAVPPQLPGRRYLVDAQHPDLHGRASAYFSLSYGQTPSDLNQGSNYTQQQIARTLCWPRSRSSSTPSSTSWGSTTTTQDLARDVSAKASVDSVIVDVTADSTSPEQAARSPTQWWRSSPIVVSGLSPQVDGRSLGRGDDGRPGQAAQFQSSPNTRLNVLIAGVAGLLVGLLAALRGSTSTLGCGPRRICRPRSAVLGSDRGRQGRPAPAHPRALASGTSRRQRIAHEAFRTLRTNLGFLDVDTEVRVMRRDVERRPARARRRSPSTCRGAGREQQQGHPGRRRPAPAEGGRSTWGSRVRWGWRTRGRPGHPRRCVQPWNREGLFVLPAGSTPPNPGGLLGSNSVRDLSVSCARDYDYVIIDAPPLVPVTDARWWRTSATEPCSWPATDEPPASSFASSTESLAVAQARSARRRVQPGRAAQALERRSATSTTRSAQ